MATSSKRLGLRFFGITNGVLLFGVLAVGAIAAEPRILSFGDELTRARQAIGAGAECRVTVEDLYAECTERNGGHYRNIRIAFTPGQQKGINFNFSGPPNFDDNEFYKSIAERYGVPLDVVAKCLNRKLVPRYSGDYEIDCQIGMNLKYARPF